ncbi:hypothetical protein V8F20_011621 [Naviculisporaceae sp. PSN 640]
MAANDDPYVHCRNEWIRAYNEGPHTSFMMFQDVMSELGLSAREIFRDPTPLLGFQARDLDERRLNDLLDDYTWRDCPGRCTTFAIRVVRRLQQMYPDHGFEFEFFNLGKHRVARCKQYGFVIDSESKRGIEVLRDNAIWENTPDDKRGRWKYYNNHSVFEDGTDPNDVHDVDPIPASLALAICLEQVARRAVLVCLFRSMEDQIAYPPIEHQGEKAKFHGSIRWRLAERRIELLPDITRKEQFATITFGPQGSPETNKACARKLVAFIRRCGIEGQWKSGGIDKFNKELWGAALKEWGYPVYAE